MALGAQARTTSPSPRTWALGWGIQYVDRAGRFTAAPGPAPAPGKVGKGGPKTTERTQRYKCPVHHGKKPSVAVGYIGDRAWAKCWSHGCPSKDILAALNLSNSQSIPWTPPPPKRSRPTLSIKPLTPVSHTQALDYLFGIRTPEGAGITYQRDDGQSGRHWRNPDKRRNPGVTGDGWQLRRFDPADPSAALVIALSEGEKDAAIMASSGVIAFTAPRGAQSLPQADFTELVALAKKTGLPVLLCGDNDKVGRDAMLKVDSLVKTRFEEVPAL